jgi:hypothetical protein
METANNAKETKADVKAAKARAKAMRPWYAKKRFIIPGALLVIAIFSSVANTGDSTSPSAPEATETSGTVVEESTEETSTDDSAFANETTGERNARGSAESYLRNMAFSKTGLIDQLLFEGFSDAEAEYAVGAVTVDWQEQAAKSAESYLRNMAFSKTGLVKQLVFEGFTEDEAEFGVAQSDADWNEQAAKSAKSYLENMSFSREGLIDQLEFEGFTTEEAEYGVSQNGY